MGKGEVMRAFMAPSHGHPGVTRVVASFLVPEVEDSASERHAGSFEMMVGQVGQADHHAGVNRSVWRMWHAVDLLVRRSTGLCCSGVFLHIIHNLDPHVIEDGHVRNNVTYHGFSAKQRKTALPRMPMNDMRFILMESLLRRILWDCAFAIDLTDIDVMRLPTCWHLPANRLAIAADTCGMRRWLVQRAGLMSLNETWDREIPGFRAFLAEKHNNNRCPSNTGVIGGRREAFSPALRQVARRLRELWQHTSGPVVAGADMVIWNEVICDFKPRATAFCAHPADALSLGVVPMVVAGLQAR